MRDVWLWDQDEVLWVLKCQVRLWGLNCRTSGRRNWQGFQTWILNNRCPTYSKNLVASFPKTPHRSPMLRGKIVKIKKGIIFLEYVCFSSVLSRSNILELLTIYGLRPKRSLTKEVSFFSKVIGSYHLGVSHQLGKFQQVQKC